MGIWPSFACRGFSACRGLSEDQSVKASVPNSMMTTSLCNFGFFEDTQGEYHSNIGAEAIHPTVPHRMS